MYFIVYCLILMVILVFFLVISVNRRLFRYFGYFGKSSYRCYWVPSILVSKHTPKVAKIKCCGYFVNGEKIGQNLHLRRVLLYMCSGTLNGKNFWKICYIAMPKTLSL